MYHLNYQISFERKGYSTNLSYRTPQQNGVVERKSLIESAKCMLDAELDNHF